MQLTAVHDRMHVLLLAAARHDMDARSLGWVTMHAGIACGAGWCTVCSV